MHQMSLAEPGAAVDIEGVVRGGRALGNRQRGGACQLIAGANNERIESVFGNQAGIGIVLRDIAQRLTGCRGSMSGRYRDIELGRRLKNFTSRIQERL